MKAFVTGGTGFLGRHVVRKLVERGYDVYGLTRSEAGEAILRDLGATPVRGTINEAASMRPAMSGSDVVFHLAGHESTFGGSWMQAESVNVGGTRTVLSLARELGVPRIVYTSSGMVFGDTRGALVDETHFQEGPFLSEHQRTKWLAHYKVVEPMIAEGAPIIIVIPGGVYGPGGSGWVMQLMHLFYEGRLPILIAPKMVHTYAHVEDIAEGHLLAAEKGKVGESYILAGPAIPLGEIVDFWALLTGRPSPVVRLPGKVTKSLAPVLAAVESMWPLPELLSEELLKQSDGTYMIRADKARVELGWRARSLQEGMSATFAWMAETTPEPERVEPAVGQRAYTVASLALLASAALLLLWLLGRRRKA
jgi:dihydroflavonol-4-reductase